MGTNFLSLPSSGFTGLSPKKQPAPSHNFLPKINIKTSFGISQQSFLIKIARAFYYTICKAFTFSIPINPAKFLKFPSILCYL